MTITRKDKSNKEINEFYSVKRFYPRFFWLSVIISTVIGGYIRLQFGIWYGFSQSLVSDYSWYRFAAFDLSHFRQIIDPFTGKPTASHPPGLSIYLALGDLLNLSSINTQVVEFIFLGIITVPLLAVLANKIAGPVVGSISAVISAIDPRLFFNDALILPEPLLLDLSIVALLLCYGLIIDGFSLKKVILMCLVLGCSVLTRSDAMVLALLIIAPLSFKLGKDLLKRILLFGFMSLLVAIAVVPWTVRNVEVFHSFVPLSTDLGLTLIGNNCNLSYYGANTIGSWQAFYCSREVPNPNNRYSEVQLDNKMTSVAINYVKAHPGRAILVGFARVLRPFGLYDPSSEVQMENIAPQTQKMPGSLSYSFISALLWVMFFWAWITAAISIFGFIFLARNHGNPYYLLAPIIYSVSIMYIFTTDIRFSAVVEPSIIIGVSVVIARFEKIINKFKNSLSYYAATETTGQTQTPVGAS